VLAVPVPVPIDGATGLVVGGVGAADGARADEASTTDAVPLVAGETADAAPLAAATAGAGSFCRCTLQTCEKAFRATKAKDTHGPGTGAAKEGARSEATRMRVVQCMLIM
jgi:hypothetical protein